MSSSRVLHEVEPELQGLKVETGGDINGLYLDGESCALQDYRSLIIRNSESQLQKSQARCYQVHAEYDIKRRSNVCPPELGSTHATGLGLGCYTRL